MRDLIPRLSAVEIIERHIEQYDGNHNEVTGAIVTQLRRCLAELQCVPEVKVEESK